MRGLAGPGMRFPADRMIMGTGLVMIRVMLVIPAVLLVVPRLLMLPGAENPHPGVVIAPARRAHLSPPPPRT